MPAPASNAMPPGDVMPNAGKSPVVNALPVLAPIGTQLVGVVASIIELIDISAPSCAMLKPDGSSFTCIEVPPMARSLS